MEYCQIIYVRDPSNVRNDKFVRVCWTEDDDGSNGSANNPPSEGGVDTGIPTDIPGPAFDPGEGDGTVVVAGSNPPPTGPMYGPNPGWNSGAYSVQSVPADWSGMISFDLPDVQGARQGGVAVGVVGVSALPSAVGRSGYDHMDYGLVVTSDYLRVVHAGQVVLDMPYTDVRDAREPDTDTDLVSVLMYGAFVKWIVNGLTLWAAPFTMPEAYALDATLYLAFDAVDNPEFLEGEWGDVEDGSLNGVMRAFEMTADASPGTSLVLQMQGFDAQLSEDVIWNLFGNMQGFGFEAGQGEGITGQMGPFSMIAADIANYAPLVGAMKPFAMTAGMGLPDESVSYSVLFATAAPFAMSMSFPPTARLEASMRGFEMRASSEASYTELRASMSGFRMRAYGGDLTPFIQIEEKVGAMMQVYQSTYIGLVFIERIGGSVEAVGYATITAEALEAITAQDSASYSATILDMAMESLGLGERVIVLSHRTSTGALVEDGEAWVVNTRTQASSRYNQYGFNSFAMVRGRHFGARTTGLFLLEGKDDDGEAITSGVNLGRHNFGTQQEKTVRAVYAGVSTLGRLFLKISDGRREFTYKAIRAESRMNTQRFDPGRGLQSNYFNFVLVSEGDSFELDTVEFDVLASQRRI